MKRSLFGAAIALACICSASAAEAQSVNPIKFGVAGGLSMPTGDLEEVVSSGFNVTGMLGFQAPMVPFGLRLDVGYNGFGEKEDNGVSANILSGTLNGMFNLGMAPMVSPYIIGGVGMYRSKAEIEGLGEDLEAETDFGFNGGVGIRFGLSGFSTFAEARFHSVMSGGDDEEGEESGNTNFIPIVFGIMF